MIRHFFSRQFVGFLLTGGFAAVLNFASRIYFNQWLDYPTSIVLAYLVGMVTAFILARLLVFKRTRRSVKKSAFFFVLVNGVAIVQTLIISLALDRYALPYLGFQEHAPEIAHAVGVVFPVFTSYLGHKSLSFNA